jgi:hypothetical protein
MNATPACERPDHGREVAATFRVFPERCDRIGNAGLKFSATKHRSSPRYVRKQIAYMFMTKIFKKSMYLKIKRLVNI